MKILIILLFISTSIFGQSVSISDLQSFASRPQNLSKNALEEKGFFLSQGKVRREGDTIKIYRKGEESIYLGDSYISANGRKLKSTSYLTANKPYYVGLMEQIKTAGFNYDDEKEDTILGGKWIYLSTTFYSIQLFMPNKNDEFASIQVIEK